MFDFSEAKDATLAFMVSGTFLWLTHNVKKMTRLVDLHELKHEIYDKIHDDFEKRIRHLEWSEKRS